jgi:phosphatidylinositol alpha-1,6-mannosyltransferase
VPHLLVTNDFPPKIGGIQSYLYELWRRLPPDETTVLTTAYPGAAEWDRDQPFRIVRSRSPFLAPTPGLARRIDELAREVGADLVMIDPAWPLGALGPQLERPFGVILHGAEVTVPARLPFAQLPLRRTLREASLVVAAGEYPAAQGRYSAGRPLTAAIVPPGVDAHRFAPLPADQRAAARRRFELTDRTVAVLGVSRLVRRKGFDVLIHAAADLVADDPDLDLTVLIAGSGRDRARLDRIVEQTGAPVRLLGRIDDDELPALYSAADVFAMLCRDQWGGLEQEGFGIVFLEAAAAGLPAVAGASGGSSEAVADGVTGIVVDDARSVDDVRNALERLVRDEQTRWRMGSAARERAVRAFSYDHLAQRLRVVLDAAVGDSRLRRAREAEQAEPVEQAVATTSSHAAPGGAWRERAGALARVAAPTAIAERARQRLRPAAEPSSEPHGEPASAPLSAPRTVDTPARPPATVPHVAPPRPAVAAAPVRPRLPGPIVTTRPTGAPRPERPIQQPPVQPPSVQRPAPVPGERGPARSMVGPPPAPIESAAKPAARPAGEHVPTSRARRALLGDGVAPGRGVRPVPPQARIPTGRERGAFGSDASGVVPPERVPADDAAVPAQLPRRRRLRDEGGS